MSYDTGLRKKYFWVFIILLTAAVVLVPIGLDALGNALANNPEHTYMYESLGMLTVLFICVMILVVFYIINTIVQYKARRALPKDFWSAWGITKKAIALICVILCIVFFIITLANVIGDLNDKPVYKTIVLSEDNPNSLDNRALNVAYYEDTDIARETLLSKNSVYLKTGVELHAGKAYKIRVFERGNFWVAVEQLPLE